MNYRKDIQEIMEYLTHNNKEELKISYAELARRYNCDYRTIKIFDVTSPQNKVEISMTIEET